MIAESMVAFTLEQRSHGIHHFQLKVGNDPRADAHASLAVVDATGDDDLILADANGGWRRQDAVVAARIMDGAERLYLEQPCPTLAECLLVRRNTTLPFVLDEVITDVDALVEAAQAGGMEAINLKINRVGGLTKAKLVRDVAVELGHQADHRRQLGRRPHLGRSQSSRSQHSPACAVRGVVHERLDRQPRRRIRAPLARRPRPRPGHAWTGRHHGSRRARRPGGVLALIAWARTQK